MQIETYERGITLSLMADNIKAISGPSGKRIIAQTLNREVGPLRTKVRRAIAQQTGLSVRVANKAVTEIKATPGNLTYRLHASGGDIRLKYFNARETRTGVSAAPRNVRQIFAHSFIMGGRFPNRVPLNMGNQVFIRTGKNRFPIELERSGVYIPEELVRGETRRTWEVSSPILGSRIMAEVQRRVEART